WGHAGTTEYALERSIPPLRHQKTRAELLNSPPASIEQYRGNVDLSGHIESLGTITTDSFSIEKNSQTNPAGWSISEILSAGNPETDDHGPDLTSTGGVLINEPQNPTFFSDKINRGHDILLILIEFDGLSLTESIHKPRPR
ncbi:UNVERIFIED_CONTAM: hypothetical protein Sradi_7311400, partial [Sesamum radiatum]